MISTIHLSREYMKGGLKTTVDLTTVSDSKGDGILSATSQTVEMFNDLKERLEKERRTNNPQHSEQTKEV